VLGGLGRRGQRSITERRKETTRREIAAEERMVGVLEEEGGGRGGGRGRSGVEEVVMLEELRGRRIEMRLLSVSGEG
jgi:hypothetical protein